MKKILIMRSEVTYLGCGSVIDKSLDVFNRLLVEMWVLNIVGQGSERLRTILEKS